MSDQWGTPKSIIDLLPAGEYFDPCPHEKQPICQLFVDNNKNKTVKIYRRKESYPEVNGLQIPWSYKNLVNPPFSNPVPWVDMAMDLWLQSMVQSIVILPDHTDRKWWLNSVQRRRLEVVFIGRKQYVPLEGQKQSQPRFGTSLVFIGFPDGVIQDAITSVCPA